jgi:hypothetical protein
VATARSEPDLKSWTFETPSWRFPIDLSQLRFRVSAWLSVLRLSYARGIGVWIRVRLRLRNSLRRSRWMYFLEKLFSSPFFSSDSVLYEDGFLCSFGVLITCYNFGVGHIWNRTPLHALRGACLGRPDAPSISTFLQHVRHKKPVHGNSRRHPLDPTTTYGLVASSSIRFSYVFQKFSRDGQWLSCSV